MDILPDQFEKEVLQHDGVVMVDFYSTYCAPCQQLAPIVEEMAKEYEGKLKVVKYNIDNGTEVIAKYGIIGVPAILFFKQGKVVKQLNGFQSKPNLVKAVEEVLSG